MEKSAKAAGKKGRGAESARMDSHKHAHADKHNSLPENMIHTLSPQSALVVPKDQSPAVEVKEDDNAQPPPKPHKNLFVTFQTKLEQIPLDIASNAKGYPSFVQAILEDVEVIV